MLFKQSDADRHERFNFRLEDDLEFATDVLPVEPEKRPAPLDLRELQTDAAPNQIIEPAIQLQSDFSRLD